MPNQPENDEENDSGIEVDGDFRVKYTVDGHQVAREDYQTIVLDQIAEHLGELLARVRDEVEPGAPKPEVGKAVPGKMKLF